MPLKKIWIFLCGLFLFPLLSFAQNFTKGEELFRQNKPKEAIPYLQKACDSGENGKSWTYLALSYYQMENYQKSLEVSSKGMKVSGTNKKILAYNAGNSAFAQGDFEDAEKWYNKAIAADSQYAPPVLNRANSRLKRNQLRSAKSDYILYLELSPDDPQEDSIRKLIALLDEEADRIEKEEQDRLAEEKRIKEEEERIAEEEARAAAEKAAEEARLAAQKAAEDAERRRRLLEDVATSIQNNDTVNMTAGAEDTIDYGYESELE